MNALQRMMEVFRAKNELLVTFALINLLLGICFVLVSFFSKTEVSGVNAWHKPGKFAFSIGLYCLTMALYTAFLPVFNTRLFSYTIIFLLGFEIIYIAWQAYRGQLSHFNVSTPIYSILYVLMAIAATIVTLYTAFVGIQFFTQPIALPVYTVWGIRLGIVCFVVFAFEGFLMGSRLSHTIGGTDGNHGWYFLGWSKRYGDPRVAHFIGMHALQIIPFCAHFVLKNTKLTIVCSLMYFILATLILMQALAAKPLLKG